MQTTIQILIDLLVLAVLIAIMVATLVIATPQNQTRVKSWQAIHEQTKPATRPASVTSAASTMRNG